MVVNTQVSTPQRHGAGWLVPSASGPGTYYVEITEERVRCTCPQWVYAGRKRGIPCKHIRRAMAMTTEGTLRD
jgi:SWIM zinc finger